MRRRPGLIQESVAADVRRLCSSGFFFEVSRLRSAATIPLFLESTLVVGSRLISLRSLWLSSFGGGGWFSCCSHFNDSPHNRHLRRLPFLKAIRFRREPTSMDTSVQEAPTEKAVPTDFLSEWIRKGKLLSLILDAGQTLDWPEHELKLAARSGYAFRRLVLLTVVTYSYATGVYGSRNIAS